MTHKVPWFIRCYECGGRLRTIGFVPPKTVECQSCGEVFRMTERNWIKCANAWKKKRRENPSISYDGRPRSIKPSWKKFTGER